MRGIYPSRFHHLAAAKTCMHNAPPVAVLSSSNKAEGIMTSPPYMNNSRATESGKSISMLRWRHETAMISVKALSLRHSERISSNHHLPRHPALHPHFHVAAARALCQVRRLRLSLAHHSAVKRRKRIETCVRTAFRTQRRHRVNIRLAPLIQQAKGLFQLAQGRSHGCKFLALKSPQLGEGLLYRRLRSH